MHSSSGWRPSGTSKAACFLGELPVPATAKEALFILIVQRILKKGPPDLFFARLEIWKMMF
jgi:hypothetical protein